MDGHWGVQARRRAIPSPSITLASRMSLVSCELEGSSVMSRSETPSQRSLALLANVLSTSYTHAQLDNLFMLFSYRVSRSTDRPSIQRRYSSTPGHDSR